LDKILLRLDDDSYYREPHPKDAIFLHHSESFFRPDWLVKSWDRDKRDSTNKIRYGAAFVIGGQSPLDPKNQEWDGKVVQAFDPSSWSHSLSIKAKNNTFLNQKSISIEICNLGPLDLNLEGNFFSSDKILIPEDQVCELAVPFRGHKYFHKYSDKQLDSLKKLIVNLSEKFEIDLGRGLKKEILKSELQAPENISVEKLQKWLNKNGFLDERGEKLVENGIMDPKTKFAFDQIGKNPFSLNFQALNGASGLWSHSNVRMDVSDVFPQPELIAMIKTL
jgi:hypothetical protein